MGFLCFLCILELKGRPHQDTLSLCFAQSVFNNLNVFYSLLPSRRRRWSREKDVYGYFNIFFAFLCKEYLHRIYEPVKEKFHPVFMLDATIEKFILILCIIFIRLAMEEWNPYTDTPNTTLFTEHL